ncbi:MAG TPA: LysM domain-containing protein [Actinoplanes sp.]|jgi:hypothetical protein
MLDPSSRYASVGVATTTVPDGAGQTRDVRFLRRRFPPQPDTLRTLAEHRVVRGDRVDLIAAGTLGDPTQFWRICDANPVIHPAELCAPERIGEPVRIPFPQG